jgi:L-alanine-DL-glutamate epimerase-like enolase superfamily enzyme
MRGLIETGGIRVIQADPDWAGGITEQMEICSICSVRGVPVVAHGHTLLAALHVAAAQPPHVVPMVEYLILHQERSQYFHKVKYAPSEGRVVLPTLPGLGIELDDSVVTARRELDW